MTDRQLDTPELAKRWLDLHAGPAGDLRRALAAEAAEYFQLDIEDVLGRMAGGAEAFSREWAESRVDGRDEADLVRFYDRSKTEVFDLLEWHASDPIHLRTLVCVDIARRFGAKRVLDYGSGIGTDAIAFGEAGCSITLADVSEPLLQFAEWRCRRRGYDVHCIDLKRSSIPRQAFDAVICFDVLEHIPNPLPAVRTLRNALATHGMLFLHAPFGVDQDRPMHVAHADVVTPRLRAMGFHNREDMNREFPPELWAPRVYERIAPRTIDRIAYYLQDVVLPPSVGRVLGSGYRRLVRRSAGAVPRAARDATAD